MNSRQRSWLLLYGTLAAIAAIGAVVAFIGTGAKEQPTHITHPIPRKERTPRAPSTATSPASGPVTYYRGRLVPMSRVPMTQLQRQMTCDGCPPAEAGAPLLRDLAIARAVNLVIGDLPAGWEQVAPPSSASSDIAPGVSNSAAALRFISCMGLHRSKRSDVLYDADQLLNIGSPVFATGGHGSKVPSPASLSSWVDMVSLSASTRPNLVLQDTRRFSRCAHYLFAQLSAGSLATRMTARDAVPGLGIDIRTPPMPPGTHGMTIYFTIPGSRYAFWLGIVQARRVYGTLDLRFPSHYRPGTRASHLSTSKHAAFYTFLKSQLYAMATRAMVAQGTSSIPVRTSAG
ncbi:MAG: hypothetical protein ACYDEY_09725 [Acidimicrobiales bacterium]